MKSKVNFFLSCVSLSLAISVVIALGKGVSAWEWVVAYWTVQVVRNFIDYVERVVKK